MVALKITSPPSAIVSVDDMKKHMNIFHDDDDVLIGTMILSATSLIDGKNGITGRSIGSQTWELYLDEFPSGNDDILIPLAPLQSISSIMYRDAITNTNKTLSDAEYSVDNVSEPARVSALTAWPNTKKINNAVKITFISGYVDIPSALKHAVKLLVAHFYTNRSNLTDSKMVEMPFGVSSLLLPFRNWN